MAAKTSFYVEQRSVSAAIAAAAERISVVFKDKQLEALLAFMSGKDTFVSLPTGYGKSLIYALLPSAFDNLKGFFGLAVAV